MLFCFVEVCSSGKYTYYPLNVYCYYPLKMYIQRMLLCPGFINLCRQWKYKPNWCLWLRNLKNSYVIRDKIPLNTIALMLNVDWFKHLTYSVGVIYLTLMNLPHMYRFKKENVLTVGILPRHRLMTQTFTWTPF